MANKRNLKKIINYICSDLFSECIATSLYSDKKKQEEVNAILASFGVYVLVDELLDVDLKRVFEKIFPKNEKTNS